MTTSRTEQYGYDDVNRLSSVDYGDGGSQSYTFDALGNRLSKTDTAGGTSSTTTYGYSAANMLLGTAASGGSVSPYTNDADGNTLSGGGRVNTWDSQNRLVQSIVSGTTSTFKYGADGLRRQMTVTPAGGTAVTTDYCLDGQSMVREMQRNAQNVLTPTATYLNGPRGPEYKRSDLDGTVRWYVYDGLGSVVGEVDPNGNLTSSTGYDVYGAKRGGTGASVSRHGFVGALGHVSDTETGLVYMRARYYDPNVGRFASEDPAEHGSNWFMYADDDPIDNIDRNGKETSSEGPGRGYWDGNDEVLIGLMMLKVAMVIVCAKNGNSAAAFMAVAGFTMLWDAAMTSKDVQESLKDAGVVGAGAIIWDKMKDVKSPLGINVLGSTLLTIAVYSTVCDIYSDTITGS